MQQRIETDLSLFQKGFSSQDIQSCINTLKTLQGAEKAGLIHVFLTKKDLSYESFFPLSIEEENLFQALYFALKNLQRKYTLPSIDFLVSLSSFNRPLFLNSTTVPIFSFTKETCNHKVILIPRFSNPPPTFCPWEEKIEKAFWRGLPTDGHYGFFDWSFRPRARLCLLSQKHQDLIDASFSDSLDRAFLEDYIKPPLSPNFKYLLALDDADGCPDLEWQLFTKGLVLKTASHQIEWYFDALESGKHYLSIHPDMHDLIETIFFCKNHEKQMKQIAENGSLFANKYLTYDQKLVFLHQALELYSKLYH